MYEVSVKNNVDDVFEKATKACKTYGGSFKIHVNEDGLKVVFTNGNSADWFKRVV